MPIQRRNSRKIRIGTVEVGGDAPVSIQSMTNTDTRDTATTLDQINRLARLGCEIIRVAVPDEAAADALAEITEKSPIPVIADIHFDYRLALRAIDRHVTAIRLNPGNLDSPEHIRLVAESAVRHGVPIRVGANTGSLRPGVIRRMMERGLSHDDAMAEALVVSAMNECALLEKFGVTEIKVALKSSSVPVTVAAYRKFAARTDYPLHIGVTEAGTPGRGIVKSAVGIGALLLEGIGDTLRVSLTAPPDEEVIAGRRILEACGLRDASPEIVSCPTCGRTEIDLIGLANKVEELVAEIKAEGATIHLRKIAVMGCAVNGPGEARDADLGLAGSKAGKLVMFRFGEVVGAFDPEEGLEYFRLEILKHVTQGKGGKNA
ncbi:flavodoxin-dependent (E)-4-hydroxy-3-methylbut-2-enyl-diphosphate synthase [uncultured Victivallis sp.]|uniref:flavodoxin-dependent (E)-4-hydroxy-3-methylbut-2-enyl-diphosphate synthase n=1 Tax=Victivallis sp. TaxID=2049020 RepID=UPI0025DB032F|nr:flavodoxin-dependent (E)-4-hydroxy-3-methylbut-2-enyl-diphosphate synthase [uncultured Victivallis sp.]